MRPPWSCRAFGAGWPFRVPNCGRVWDLEVPHQPFATGHSLGGETLGVAVPRGPGSTQEGTREPPAAGDGCGLSEKVAYETEPAVGAGQEGARESACDGSEMGVGLVCLWNSQEAGEALLERRLHH